MGKPSQKKEALMIDIQKEFLEQAKRQSHENQYRFILQTGLRTGELIGLKWKDVDFENKTVKIQRSMEYRYSIGEWRVGEPKSKSGYRTIPLTEDFKFFVTVSFIEYFQVVCNIRLHFG